MPSDRPVPRYLRSKRLAARQLGAEYLVVQLDRQLAVALDDRGRAALEALREPATETELMARLAASPEPPQETAGLVAFLGELVALGLVELEEAMEAPVEQDLAAAPPFAQVLWSEPLPQAVQQPSPPFLIGQPRCRP